MTHSATDRLPVLSPRPTPAVRSIPSPLPPTSPLPISPLPTPPSPKPSPQPSPTTTPQALADAVNTALRTGAVRVGAAPHALSALSTGFPALDAATGLGGLPRGRLTELIGRPTSGRETVAARSAAACEGLVAWVDLTGSLDVACLADGGVDLGRLFVLRPPTPADAFAVADRVAASGGFDLVVLDALADLPPGGPTERALAQFVRVVVPRLARTATAVLVLSAPDRYTPALAHAAALRVCLTKVGFLRPGGVFRGWCTRAQVLKSPGLQGGESGIEVWL